MYNYFLYNVCMDTETPLARFPIRELVLRTGVNASTLRAWESRHALLKPVRTDSGHRLYSQQDVRRVRRLQELLTTGMSLNEIAPLLDVSPLVPERVAEPTMAASREPVASAWAGYLEETLLALEDFNSDRLDRLYNEACALYPIDLVTDNLLIPVLGALGQRWDKRVTGIAEEHFFSAWLRNKLGARLHHAAGQMQGELVVLACLTHEHHEIGLLLFTLTVLQRGYRVIYLGANMPTRQIVHVARNTQARAVVLSGRAVNEVAPVVADIAYVVNELAMPVFVGSHFSLQAQAEILAAGATPLGTQISAGMARLEKQLGRHVAVGGRR